MPAARIRRALPLLLLILLALAVRLPHLGWGLPAIDEEAYPARKAIGMWDFAAGRTTWNPETAGWPALSFYAQLLLQHLQYALGRLAGTYGDRLDYQVAWLLDPSPMILWGRALAALLSAGIVTAGAVLGRRLAGTAGLWIAGLVLAASPLLVRHAQLIDPDGWVGLFAALAVLAIVAVAQAGRLRPYLLAGLWIGLGTASKYTPLLLAISLGVVHLQRLGTEGRSRRRLGLDDRRIWLAGLAALLAFVIASPYTLLDLGVLRRDLGWQGGHLASGHFGHVNQGPGWIHYLRTVLPAALGWPAFLLGVAGLGLAARSDARHRALLWCVLPMLLVLGALQTHFDRYMIPLLMPLAVGAALAWTAVADRFKRRGGPVVAAAVVVLLLLPPGVATWRYHRAQALPSTGALAGAWLAAHVDPARESVLTERYGPDLAPDLRGALERDPEFAGLSEAQRARLAARPVIGHQVIPMDSRWPELADWFYDLRLWTAYDWFATSGGVKNRYLAEPARFPREAAFYADLDRYAVAAARFEPGPAARGPEIRIYRLDDEGRARLRAERGTAHPGRAPQLVPARAQAAPVGGGRTRRPGRRSRRALGRSGGLGGAVRRSGRPGAAAGGPPAPGRGAVPRRPQRRGGDAVPRAGRPAALRRLRLGLPGGHRRAAGRPGGRGGLLPRGDRPSARRRRRGPGPASAGGAGRARLALSAWTLDAGAGRSYHPARRPVGALPPSPSPGSPRSRSVRRLSHSVRLAQRGAAG